MEKLQLISILIPITAVKKIYSMMKSKIESTCGAGLSA